MRRRPHFALVCLRHPGPRLSRMPVPHVSSGKVGPVLVGELDPAVAAGSRRQVVAKFPISRLQRIDPMLLPPDAIVRGTPFDNLEEKTCLLVLVPRALQVTVPMPSCPQLVDVQSTPLLERPRRRADVHLAVDRVPPAVNSGSDRMSLRHASRLSRLVCSGQVRGLRPLTCPPILPPIRSTIYLG